MKNIINPWAEFKMTKGMKESKESLLFNYKKISYFPFLPKLSLKTSSEFAVIGADLYFNLSNDLQKKSHLILKPRDFFKHWKNFLKFINNFTLDLNIYKKVYFNLVKDKYEYEYNYIYNTLLTLRPKILIISSTIDPVQRIWAFHGRKLGIKIVTIQHGIYSSLSSPYVLERNITDFYFSINIKQSEIIKKLIPISKHRYLYSEDSFFYQIPKNKKIKICFLGSDHERYGLKGKQNKKSVINIYERLIRVIKNSKNIEFKILYKKHPSEEWIGNLKKHVLLTKNINSENIDIFFGVASTMLVKLASNKKCAFQIASADFIQDRYENFSFCKTIDIEKIEKNGIDFLFQNEIEIPCLKENNFNELLRSTISEIPDNNNLIR